jgi:MarR family transcriptional regulator, organic hydroperoxide resistance regulator
MTRHRDESLAAPQIRGRAKAVIGSAPSKRSAARSAKEMPAPAPAASRDSGRDHEGYLIKELQHRLRTQIESRIRAKGLWLSFPHSVVLMTLREEPGLSGAQLARRNSVTAQTMNGLLMPLESKGLIARRADPENARILQCYLKPKGVEVLEQGMHEAKGVFSLMLGKLSERERSEFRRILQRCIDALQGGDRAADNVSLVPVAKRKVRQLAA